MRRAAWLWVIGLTNASLLALMAYTLGRYGLPDRGNELALVFTLVAIPAINFAGVCLFWLGPRETERLGFAVQMAELRKRLTAAGATTVTQVGLRPPLSRRLVGAVIALNVVALFIVLKYFVKLALHDPQKTAGFLTMVPLGVALVGVYVLWASDDLSVLRRELRRAELLAQLKALQ
jgi:hypothetical protein